MKRYINRLMARFGYVPVEQVDNLRAAIDGLTKSIDIQAASVPLKIEVDDSQVRESLALLEQLTPAALAAEARLAKLWSIQEAMQCRQASNGSGGVCGPSGSASESASRTAALNELGEQSGAIGIRVINEASAAAGQTESRQTD